MISQKIQFQIQKFTSLIAIGFGIITIIAGSRVLFGYSEPGYIVFYPLLIFNSLMGFFYATAGILIWIDMLKGKKASFILFMVNLLVLMAIIFLSLFDFNVATESIIAMSFRTFVWLAIYAVLKFIHR